MQIQAIRKAKSTKNSSEETEEQPTTSSSSGGSIRKFLIPSVNLKATCYQEMTNGLSTSTEEPPLIQKLSNDDIAKIQHSPLVCLHSCHNQAVERHVKVVSEASSVVCGLERRDGLIRQRLKSRRLMKRFDTRQQFVC